MRALFRRWPLMAIALLLLAAYIGMAEWNHGDDGPRTFVAALAALTLGYALGSGNGNGHERKKKHKKKIYDWEDEGR